MLRDGDDVNIPLASVEPTAFINIYDWYTGLLRTDDLSSKGISSGTTKRKIRRRSSRAKDWFRLRLRIRRKGENSRIDSHSTVSVCTVQSMHIPDVISVISTNNDFSFEIDEEDS